MITRDEAKQLIDMIGESTRVASNILGVKDLGEGIEPGEWGKFEVAMFLMYLSASDGEIEWRESKNISYLCNLKWTPYDLERNIREGNFYSVDFENTVPISFRMIIDADNEMIRQGTISSDITSTMIDSYKLISEFFINDEHNVTYNEERDRDTYIGMLEKYVNENSMRQRKSVIAPSKSGISNQKKWWQKLL